MTHPGSLRALHEASCGGAGSGDQPSGLRKPGDTCWSSGVAVGVRIRALPKGCTGPDERRAESLPGVVKHPVRFLEARSWGRQKTPQWSAERRAASMAATLTLAR